MSRALFLSGSVGAGHDVVATAYTTALEPFGVRSETLDSMHLLGRTRSAVVNWVTRKMMDVHTLYDSYYFSQLRVDTRFARRSEKGVVDAMEPRLRHEVERFCPDLVVPVFPTGAAAASRLKGQGYEFRTVVFVTEAFVYRWWVQESTDLFLATSRVAAESIRRFWPEAPIVVVTPPVRPEFWNAPSQEEARASLKIPFGARCVLVMSGGWGMAPLDLVARELADDGCWVLAVGAKNRALVEKLRTLSRSHPNVVPFGYTDRVPELMAASDVVVTSSGVACWEARVVGRSLVLLDIVPGHAREDVMHELELGAATVSSLTPSTLRRTVRTFLADPERSKPVDPPARGAAERQFVEALRNIGFDLD